MYVNIFTWREQTVKMAVLIQILWKKYHVHLPCYLHNDSRADNGHDSSSVIYLSATQIYDTALNTQLWALSCSYPISEGSEA